MATRFYLSDELYDGAVVSGPSEATLTTINGGVGAATQEAVAQTLSLARNATVWGVMVRLKKIGTPADTLLVKLTTTLGGSALASATLSAASLTTVFAYYLLTFDTAVALTAGTTYNLEFWRSPDTADTVNAVQVCRGFAYANGAAQYLNASAWVAQTHDLMFALQGPKPSCIYIAYDANWEEGNNFASGGVTRRPLWTKANLGEQAKTTLTNYNNASINGGTEDVIQRQYVSDPLRAQTISGTISAVIKCVEGAVGANASLAVVVRAVSQDGGTVRGTIFSVFGVDTEFATTAATRIISAQAITSTQIQDGDRLVIEIGHHLAAGTAALTVGEQFGTSGGSDYALTTALVTDLNPWIEFSGDLIPAMPENYKSVKVNGSGISVGERFR